jgi:hypothetical protein
VIRRQLGGVQRCYEDSLTSHPEVVGDVRIVAHFIIGADGRVTTATVDGSDDTVLTTCVAVRVRSWEFPAPAGGGVVGVNYPFVLSSQ